jgi:flavin reductase (DIM6/NTAB) family NADH-FMN oxidoreductase RutF
MSLDPDSFRAALGRFATGVTVVTARDASGADLGMTVSAFSSLSLTPPLILVCIARQASMHDTMVETTHFVVNVLSSDQEAIARRFADTDAKRFDGIGYTRGMEQIAVLEDALAYLECRRVAQYEAGDHTIIVGEVEGAVMSDAKPLLYYRGGFAQLER